mmetsp:Transcript_34973/g.69441  ORF Transcript_34973/g.69441 Transcript_34973/m.69441 type:complete len:306 (-) Transcript_34973:165-1082(-)|eukprot:CAMPEP_0170217260 /NCGR_PEP_ID=MMETSP0116_2-20130129/8292_1 /TAXON_ID=400756 /ORGANISM="Durinskia baltica, Strain CSIRO CS-38" /LENGTH=305 /DNA_ID=CAMNT_0010467887 /DNA_START=179 /DNA_END=1096 /DNA_ORIENTATION=-
MVFTHALDSVMVSSSDAEDGHRLEEIKGTGPQLSLKDLMSPFSLSKGRLTAAHAIRNSSCHRCDQTLSTSTSKRPSTSRIDSPVVIVGPEHNFVRRREYSKESFPLHVQKADVGFGLTLPEGGTKFRQPEHSDSRPHGLRVTPVANESHRDSSSEIQTVPFSQNPHFRFPRKEATRTGTSTSTISGIKPQTATFGCAKATIMSSPKCHKPLNRRSRSIAIKSPQLLGHVSQADTVAAEEDSASNERMYDWATWRMYNRIVDHRRNQRLSSPSLVQPEASTALSTMAISHTALDDYDHGEVFEMEI